MSPKEALENLRSAILSGTLDNFTLALKIGEDIIYDQTKSPTSGLLVSGGGEAVAQFPSWVIAVVVSVTFLFVIFVVRRRYLSASQLPPAPHGGGGGVSGGGGGGGDGGGDGLTRQADEYSPSTNTEYNPVITAVTRTQSGTWKIEVGSTQHSPPPPTSPPIHRPVWSAPSELNHFTLPNAVERPDDQPFNHGFSPFVYPNNAAWHIASATIVPDNPNGLRRRRSGGGSQNSSSVAAQQNFTADADAVEEVLFNGQPVFGRRQSGGISDI